jgi:hypothetical protein
MPIPKPRSKEKRSDFIGRCVSQISSEYKDNKQAVAICYNQFKEAKASADGVVDLEDDEMLILKDL